MKSNVSYDSMLPFGERQVHKPTPYLSNS